MASASCAAGTKMSGELSAPARSGTTKPYPEGFAWETSHDEIHLVWESHAVSGDLKQQAIRDESPHQAPELDAVLSGNLQMVRQLAHRGGVVHVLSDESDDVFTGWHERGGSSLALGGQDNLKVSHVRTRRA